MREKNDHNKNNGGKKEQETAIELVVAVSSGLFRDGIDKILQSEKDINIAAKVSTASGIISLIEKMAPDILFIDTSLPNLNLIRIVESVCEKGFKTKILLLLHTVDEEFMATALSIGIGGYLKPGATAEQFVRAIRAINKEEVWAERRIVTMVLKRLLRQCGDGLARRSSFTKKEEEVVRLVVLGCRNGEIADKLFITENTVKTHLVHVFRKLGIRSRVQLISLLANPFKGESVLSE